MKFRKKSSFSVYIGFRKQFGKKFSLLLLKSQALPTKISYIVAIKKNPINCYNLVSKAMTRKILGTLLTSTNHKK